MAQQVIGFHYTLKDKGGATIDSSVGATPLLFLEGSGQIIPGLEKELLAMEIGKKATVEIKSADAYGAVVEDLRMSVAKEQFPEGADIKVGDQFQVNEEPTAPIFTIVDIEGDNVHIDGNHPLAGQDLSFDVEVTEKRAATEEEVAHGHAHGAGGHNHG